MHKQYSTRHKIFKIAVILFVLIMVSYSFRAEAAATNVWTQPTCTENVKALPIFLLKSRKDKTALSFGLSTTFLVGQDLWATSAHSTGYGTNEIIEILINGEIVPAKVLLADTITDVALLRAPSGKLKPLDLATAKLIKFEEVWTVGFPGYDQLELHSYMGMILNLTPEGYLKLNALTVEGMSGGPAFRCHEGKLEVFGINVAHPWTVLRDAIMITEEYTTRTTTIVNSGIGIVSPITNLTKHIKMADAGSYIVWDKLPILVFGTRPIPE